MNAGMDVQGGGSVHVKTFADTDIEVWVEGRLGWTLLPISPSEARELAGALRRAADELDPIPEGATSG